MLFAAELTTYGQWLAGAIGPWLKTIGALTVFALVASYVTAAVLYGPVDAADRVYKSLVVCLADLVRISPRRTLALARLAVQESLRRKVLVVFVLFAVFLLVGGWFLEGDNIDPGRLYVTVVLEWTTYLVLVMALLLSALSLPADFKNRTIYTIVTKPVRAGEIVLGRILGFTAIGTVLLALMGACSYLFVVRAVVHTHELAEADVIETDLPGAAQAGVSRQGRLSEARFHRHRVTLDADGQGISEASRGHFHEVRAVTEGGRTRYEVGPPRGYFHARVPINGQLRFKDRSGAVTQRGVSVGYESKVRSYLEGGSLAAAIWTFRDVRAGDFPEGLPVELTIRVFRTYKGEIERGILGSLVLRNPSTGLTSSPRNFLAKEFMTDRQFIPRALTDTAGNKIDLFEHLVDQGRLEIQLQCLERGMFFGVASTDIYLLAREGSFGWNFAKGCAGIWLQMVLVIAVGVAWSTFLNNAVALLATVATMLGGFFLDFIRQLAAGEAVGGGSMESLVRIFNQRSAVQQLDEGLTTTVVKLLDQQVQLILSGLARLLPDFRALSEVESVAGGFDVGLTRLAEHATMTLGFAAPAFVLGLVFLKLREAAR